jgi:hypothetical protein
LGQGGRGGYALDIGRLLQKVEQDSDLDRESNRSPSESKADSPHK